VVHLPNGFLFWQKMAILDLRANVKNLGLKISHFEENRIKPEDIHMRSAYATTFPVLYCNFYNI